jgi:hypothetical protein
MYKIINKSNNFSQIGNFEKICHDFMPHAKKYLKFDKPVTIELVSDPENAKDPLGKTAYYDPNNMKIAVFIDNRHVKDILRSLSHELVHHSQNCKGEFDKSMETGQGYAQKNPHMRKCEAEAYLHGNGLMWRDFEDNYKQKNLNLENINSKINYLLEHYEKETLVMQGKKVEESVFAPNHYCVHHGGVHMEGTVKLGKVINHNWSENLQKVTNYDMEFEDGTILEGVKAEDILVTNASLAEGHGGHMAKRDSDEEEEKVNEADDKKAHLQKQLDKLKEKCSKPGANKNMCKQKERLLKQRMAALEEGTVNEEEEVDEAKGKKVGTHGGKDVRQIGSTKGPDTHPAYDTPQGERARKGKGKLTVDREKKNENWTKGNKDQLLFERLVEKWTK